jgi:tetratricopeptide (TPR) repeat protein
MNDASRAEAAYRRAGSVFEKQSEGQQIYHALASALVADLDFAGGRYERAAGAYDQAVSLAPVLNLVHPFQHGLALLGAGRFDESITRFAAVQAGDGDRVSGVDPEVLFNEARYAANLARMAVDAGEVVGEDTDEMLLTKMLDEVLLRSIREAAREYRGVREKYAYRAGDPLPSEMKAFQRRFVALLRERLIRDARIIGFLNRESISDLVRP